MLQARGIWTIKFEHVSLGILEEVKSYAVPGPGAEVNLGFPEGKAHPSQYRVVSVHMDYVNMTALVEVM